MVKVLMVCLGNICRSPLAEGILRSKVDQSNIFVDSAGTGGWHIGELPDSRSIEIAKQKFPSKDFIVGDILDYKEDNNIKYDIVLSAADTVNHLLDKSYWNTFFRVSFA